MKKWIIEVHEWNGKRFIKRTIKVNHTGNYQPPIDMEISHIYLYPSLQKVTVFIHERHA